MRIETYEPGELLYKEWEEMCLEKGSTILPWSELTTVERDGWRLSQKQGVTSVRETLGKGGTL